jgi:hypothetical protein
VILGEIRILMIPKNQEILKKPYKSKNYLLKASSTATVQANGCAIVLSSLKTNYLP